MKTKPTKATKIKVTAIRMPAALWQKLMELAGQNRRSINAQMVTMLESASQGK